MRHLCKPGPEYRANFAFFLVMVSIFFANSLFDLLYLLAINEKPFENFAYKMIENIFFIPFIFIPSLNICFKKISSIYNKVARYPICIPCIGFVVLVFYCELEFFDERLSHDVLYAWDFGFLLGSTIITFFHRTDNTTNIQRFLGFYVILMIYLILRLPPNIGINITHLQRILTLCIGYTVSSIYVPKLIEKTFKQNRDKSLIFKKASKLKSSFLVNILKTVHHVPFALLDDSKSLNLFNKNISLKFEEEDPTILKEKILNLNLNYVSINDDPFGYEAKTSNRLLDIPEIFQSHPNIKLGECIDELRRVKEAKVGFALIFKINIDPNSSKNSLPNINDQNLSLTIYNQDNTRAYLIELVQCPALPLPPMKQPLALPSRQQSASQIEVPNRNKQIFFVSHEMRTPLNCIVSMLQIVKSYVSEQLAEEYINPALISCNFLLYLVQDLLDMAQIESDKFTINYEEFNIRLLISDIIELFKIQATSKNAEITHNISQLVPETLLSDHRRIRQILINLIGNALKFLKKTQGLIIIEVSLLLENPSHVLFVVKDNGIGIREEDKSKLFQAFGKINNEESKKLNSSGVGLGLMISNNLAQNLHPYKAEGLKIESNYGFGTKFSFLIEDKTEITNFNEGVKSKSLVENYQTLLKNNEPYHFMKKKNTISSNLNEIISGKSPNNLNNEKKEKYYSLKVLIRPPSVPDFYQLTPLLKKESSIFLKEHNERVKTHKKFNKSLKNKKNPKISSIQNFDDIHICNGDDYESSEDKMMIINHLNISRKCDCADILICDDNAFNLYSLRKQLESFNFKIDSANDGDEAIKMVEETFQIQSNCCKMYKIIFMDIEMPGKNGYETSIEIMKFLKKEHYEDLIKIIACSAHLKEEVPNKHKECGMVDFVTKPIIKGKLMILLSKYSNILYNLKL